ncbi:unnamed protein product [Rhizophagus irregularis]|uniref:ATPase domain-containing protein n=2 Tax=Rhizophagus irregularis TaxID=588596 RepID=A0A915YTF6_9GLOM|nr:unnamed protein product [Rhizophagus irregularis]CAB5206448.1 unnamed protein product [Rhizophagus irregularis]CAB5333798.1 unnamed protein product [Rhizophagus irregularis]
MSFNIINHHFYKNVLFRFFLPSFQKKFTARQLLIPIKISIGGFVLADIFYTLYQDKFDKYYFSKVIEKGTQPEVNISSLQYISQPEIVEHFKRIFKPYKNQSLYHVICGERGTGKTTLIKAALKEDGQGVIYINIPTNLNKLDETFNKALKNFKILPSGSLLKQIAQKILYFKTNSKTVIKWEDNLEAFKNGAKRYKMKHSTPPVIIYDNVDRLVPKHAEVLDILQEDAKDNADDMKYIAVFVSNKTSALKRMKSRNNAWTRVSKPVVEINNLSKEESINYLVNKRGIKTMKEGKIDITEAEKLYELVGGCIMDLEAVADEFLNLKQSSEEIKQQKFIEIDNEFNIAKLHKNQPNHEAGKHIIKTLNSNGMLDYLTYSKLFNNPEEANKVLETNIFAYNPIKNIITFNSRAIECYIRENAGIFI